MSRVLPLVLMLLPKRLRGIFARRVLGWDIHPTAVIGRSMIRVGHVTMGPNSWIASHNTLRGLDEVIMGEGCIIGSDNTIWSVPRSSRIYLHRPQREASFILRDYAFISDGHQIDCSDRVELAPYAGITGYGSQVLTHRLDLVRDEVVTEPVTIGERTVIMTGCILLSGTSVASHSIVAAGSTVVTKLPTPYTLYRGNPATSVRQVPETMRMFRRVGHQTQIAGNPDIV